MSLPNVIPSILPRQLLLNTWLPLFTDRCLAGRIYSLFSKHTTLLPASGVLIRVPATEHVLCIPHLICP